MVVVPIAVVAVALVCAMTFAWWMQRRTGKSGWIDAIWAFATGAAGAILALWPSGAGWAGRAILVAAMSACWGLRLGSHILSRTMHGGDDPRYADLKREWGDDFSRRLFWFLQIQAASALLLAISVFAAARDPAPFPGLFDVLGLILFIACITGETVADRQLKAFALDTQIISSNG
jgi:steroid 5-alpha reductase family enzyme